MTRVGIHSGMAVVWQALSIITCQTAAGSYEQNHVKMLPTASGHTGYSDIPLRPELRMRVLGCG